MDKKQISVVVIGAAGRMGQRICKIVSESDDFRLVGATESPDKNCFGKSLKEGLGLSSGTALIVEKLEEIRDPFEVIIDFTFPEVSMKTAMFASSEKKHAVIGTTGFSDEQTKKIRKLGKEFPCVCAPNMSMGVNTLFKLVKDVALILKEGFDVEIMEIHHRYKKDAPSGTALKIAQIIAESHGRNLDQTAVYQRKGIIGERKPDEIGIQTFRAGDVVGEHTVLFGGLGERLEITHKAQSRDCFVRGALFAARWIKGKPNGLYDMQDVLGLTG
jgi:4-hydroxy-tetrahydrodipicolinate reductase